MVGHAAVGGCVLLCLPLLVQQEARAGPRKEAGRRKSAKKGKSKSKQDADTPAADYELL